MHAAMAMGEFSLSSGRSASQHEPRCLLAYLQYIMCDRWVMEKPPPPRSLHGIISDKSASHVLIGASSALVYVKRGGVRPYPYLAT